MKGKGQPASLVTAAPGSTSALTLTRLLLNITFARLLLTLSVALAPLQDLFSGRVLFGRSVWSVVRDLTRWVLGVVGRLSAPVQNPCLRLSRRISVRCWHVVAAAFLAGGATRQVLRRLHGRVDDGALLRARLALRMSEAKSYFEWSVLATKMDSARGIDPSARWREETRLYDRRLLREKVSHLRKVRALGTLSEQMFALRADLLRDLGGMTSSALHDAFPVCPEPIREYLEEVRAQLEDITACPDLPLSERSTFLRETRHAFGRSALALTGAGHSAGFHLGVVRALLEQYMLPRVIAGTGQGAVVCGLVAVRTDFELGRLLTMADDLDESLFGLVCPGSQGFFGVLASLGRTSSYSQATARVRLRHALGDMTLSEAFHATGRVLNLAVIAGGQSARSPPRLLNYLTAPRVYVWSAVLAAVTGSARGLVARGTDGRDARYRLGEWGGMAGDLEPDLLTTRLDDKDTGSQQQLPPCATLPLGQIGEMFSANHWIVSQASPVIAPLLRATAAVGRPGSALGAEIKHRARQIVDTWPGATSHAPILAALAADWTGDITILPGDDARDAGSFFVGILFQGMKLAPSSSSSLRSSVRAGELATWAKLSAVQCNCGIEATLDACIHQVATWERAAAREAAAAVLMKEQQERSGSIRSASFTTTPLSTPSVTANEEEEENHQGDSIVHDRAPPEEMVVDNEQESPILLDTSPFQRSYRLRLHDESALVSPHLETDAEQQQEVSGFTRSPSVVQASDALYDDSEDCLPLLEERSDSLVVRRRRSSRLGTATRFAMLSRAAPSPESCTDDSAADVLRGFRWRPPKAPRRELDADARASLLGGAGRETKKGTLRRSPSGLPMPSSLDLVAL